MKSHADSIRGFFDAPYRVLGTDGFGRSDTRANLRRHFEVDQHYIVLAALKELMDAQVVPAKEVQKAIKDLAIDVQKEDPRLA